MMKQIVLIIILSCVSVASYAFTGEDLVGMMQTLQTNLGPLYKLVIATSYVMGIWFMVDGIFRLKKYGQARTMMSTNTSLAKPVLLFCFGLGLLYFPTLINISVQSLWAYGSNSILKYPTDTGLWNGVVNPLVDLIRLFGLIAFLRGMLILTRLANENPQPGSVGKGMMHITGGILAINIVGTVNVIKATFGLG